MENFWTKNKVFILGLLGSLAVALQQVLGGAAVDWKVIGFAALMAILSYVANQWRGQGVTVLGILGTLAYTFVNTFSSGTFTWAQFIVAALLAIFGAVAPPPKSVGYERTAVINAAKEEGEKTDPSAGRKTFK